MIVSFPDVLMRFQLRNVTIFIAAFVFTPFAWLVLFTNTDLSENTLLEQKLAELRDRLHYAESLNMERENDVHILRNQIRVLLNSQTLPNGHSLDPVLNLTEFADENRARELTGNSKNPFHQRSMSRKMDLPRETLELFGNLSQGTADLSVPGMFNYLPHLIGKPGGLKPSFKISRGRVGVSMVMGVPTIKRDKESYLLQTLDSLINNLDDSEKEDSVIIVFVAEPYDLSYVKQIASQVEERFKEHLSSGLLEIIAPSPDFYPSLDNLRETFGDSLERVKWRTKQNLDFSYLMMYARSKGTYYVQLEDDIVTKQGYMTMMKTFTMKQQLDDWILLEFCKLGFIGKLFKSRDLPLVVEFFLMFHKDKPIDWLLDHLLFVKVCNPEKDRWHCHISKRELRRTFIPDLFDINPSSAVYNKNFQFSSSALHVLCRDDKHCQHSIAELRRRFKPSLFQHIGTHSSLKGKVQKLKDKDFGKNIPIHAHINPNAEVSTTLKIYQHFSLDRAYMGETFFWGLIPQAGDTVTFRFVPPIEIESYTFHSGNTEHPGDKFYNTTVEILPVDHIVKEGGVLSNKVHEHGFKRTEDGFLIINQFTEGVAKGTVDESIGEVDTLRLRVLSQSETWVILSEIMIKSKSKKT